MLFYNYKKYYEWVLCDISRVYAIDTSGIFYNRCLTILNYYYKKYLSISKNTKNLYLADHEKKCTGIVELHERTKNYRQLIYFGIAFVALSYDDYPNDSYFRYDNLLHIAMYCFARTVLCESVIFRECAQLIEYTVAKVHYEPNECHSYGIEKKLYDFAKQLFFQYDPISHYRLEYYIDLIGFPTYNLPTEQVK